PTCMTRLYLVQNRKFHLAAGTI
ncbi:ulp1 protease family, C-terminal catalytic domain protein, partial [Chlamydia psittaci 84-8471/1]